MRGSSFGYLIKEGVRNMVQNRAISLAAVGVLVACQLLVGASVLFSLNVNSMMGYLETQNEIIVFLSDSVEGGDLAEVDGHLRELDNIASMTFISREEGLKSWVQELGDDGTLLDWLIDDNPLPNAYQVVIRDLSRMDETLAAIKGVEGVESISASMEVAEFVTGLKRAVSWVGATIVIILVGVSLLIVANTIRLTVFARRKEINIMKYVGATDTFIRLPFWSEGVLLGLVSATLSFLLLWGGYVLFGNWVANSTVAWASLVSSHLVPFADVALRLYGTFLLAGVGIGSVGGVIFVGKYLKV